MCTSLLSFPIFVSYLAVRFDQYGLPTPPPPSMWRLLGAARWQFRVNLSKEYSSETTLRLV